MRSYAIGGARAWKLTVVLTGSASAMRNGEGTLDGGASSATAGAAGSTPVPAAVTDQHIGHSLR